MKSTRPPTTSHNYVPLVAEIATRSPRGALLTFDVLHDDDCDALAGAGFCNCEPEVITREGIHPALSQAAARAWLERSRAAEGN